MEKGRKVWYKSKVYIIKWIYESGYCEIQDEDKILLVKLSELTALD